MMAQLGDGSPASQNHPRDFGVELMTGRLYRLNVKITRVQWVSGHSSSGTVSTYRLQVCGSPKTGQNS